MGLTTFEEAKLCPRCKHPGVEKRKDPGPKGSTVFGFQCENERCRYNGTGYIVQVMADGSIPTRQPGPKEFAKPSETLQQFGRDILRQAGQEDPQLQGYLHQKGL